MRELLVGVLDLVFPPACAGCGWPGTLLCERCVHDVARIDPAAACPRCGAPGPAGGTCGRAAVGPHACAECGGRPFAFHAARCASRLEPPVSRAIVALKDGGERRYAGVLAALLAEAADGWLRADDALVPVPATPAAVRRRGFDHALDLTRALGATTGLHVVGLLRSAPRSDQRALGRGERFANRQGSFALTPDVAASRESLPPRVVLVDDVLTTGATLDAAARMLRSAGVGEVRALTVARSMRDAVGCSGGDRCRPGAKRPAEARRGAT
jgi:predicted amidophosphoribosyltransferase